MPTRTGARVLVILLAAIGAVLFVPGAAAPAAAQCTDLLLCGGGSGPGVSIDPDGGSWSASAASMQVVVTITWCDENTGLSASSRKVYLDGADVTSSFGWGTTDPVPGCFTVASSTGVVTLTPGSHTLTASINNSAGQTGTGTATYSYTQTTPPPPAFNYQVSVTPDAKPITRGAGLRATERFVVANTGSGSMSVAMAPTCSGAGATSCGASLHAITIPAGGIVSVGVNYRTGSERTTATVGLAAWRSGDSAAVNDAGSHQLSVKGVPAPGVAGDPGYLTAVDRSACLMLPAGLDAAYECGDLRLAHPLPATRVLNRGFAPTLLYSSQHALPHPIVGATVHSPGPTLPTSVVATLTLAGQAARADTFPGWINGWNRVAVGFDATGLPSGFYDYTFQVKAFYPSGSQATLYSGSGWLPVVNRHDSRFGRGWWLAGLEELKVFGATLMWIGGDGSTLRYDSVSTGRWASEKYAGTDTIVRTDSGFARLVPGGDTVRFDVQGRHVRTSNRRGQRTEFTWTNGALTRISLPKGKAFDTGMAYVLDYANPYGMLSRVTAPAADAARIVNVENADGPVLAIGGPDTTWVRFAYSDARPLIGGRRDRRGVWSYFGYDAGNRLSNAYVVTGTGTSDYVPVYYIAQESRGINTATSADQVYTVFNGPRPDTDVADYTYVWVDRRGAPYMAQDNGGTPTRIYREDPSWPGVVTRVTYPSGREVTSSHDAAGRLSSTTDWGAVRDGRYATTLYEWDERCNAPSRVTLPEGEVTLRGYDARCLPAWVQPGQDSARRVRIEHFPADSAASGLVRSVTSPAPAPGQPASTERYAYDARGNLASVTTAEGIVSQRFADAIGRDTLARSPIEHNLFHRVRTQYDGMDRVTMTETIGPAMNLHPEQRLVVRSWYDAGGLPLAVSRRSIPDTARVDSLVDRWKHDALRRAYVELRPGSRDSLVFDEAGNVVKRFTSRFFAGEVAEPITMRYDQLNRLVRRITPAVTYGRITSEVRADNPLRGTTQSAGTWSFPHYSNTAGGGLLIPADTAVFVFDPVTGALLEANNRDAKVKRSYHANGALHTDSLRIRAWDSADFEQHRYGIGHVYDLDGRPVELRHPSSIAPQNAVTGQRYELETYGYDPATGALARVTSVLGHDFRFFQDLRGRADSIAYPGSVGEKLFYDRDDRETRRRVLGLNYSTDQTIHDYEYTYDLRGKRVELASSTGGDLTLRYSGLGMLVHLDGTRLGPNTTGIVNEWYAYDALGHRVSARSSSQEAYPMYSLFGTRTGRLGRTQGPTNVAYASASAVPPTTTHDYDASGNLSIYHLDDMARQKHDHTRHFYGADDRLRVSERWTCRVQSSGAYDSGYDVSVWCESKAQLSSATAGSFEEFRYDALGRRVVARSRREPYCTSASCASTITRTVWNGDQVLYEIRSPGGDGVPATTLESDEWLGQGPFWGRVAYTHGGGIDRPLEVIRIGYTPQPSSNGPYHLDDWGGPHPMILHSNWRGMVDRATTARGRPMPCQLPLQCPQIRFPAASYKAYNQSADLVARQTWYGSLIEEKTDDSGLMYMRNRYYNPTTGAFTQEDPIGLAGGLNTYGFANSDPATYNDPFGLCPPKLLCDMIGATAGAEATEHWAGIASSSSGLRKAGATAMGLLSALWTPETYQGTALTLATAGAAGGNLGAGAAGARGSAVRGGVVAYESGAGGAALSGAERALLRDFFGQGMKGVRERAASFRIPEGLGRETLLKYRRVAEDAIEGGIDKMGVQAERIKLIEKALDMLK
jgi:RHS repeat-associated protein